MAYRLSSVAGKQQSVGLRRSPRQLDLERVE